MAIVIEQQSRCSICNNLLDGNKEYLLVPPLTSNTKDALFDLSDTGVHIDCLNKSKLKNALLKHIDFYNNHFPPSKLKCVVDGMQIDKPENLLYFGLLTSNDEEELYEFNYVSLNIKNVSRWSELNRFLVAVEKFLAEKKWVSLNEFNMLEYIVRQIKRSR